MANLEFVRHIEHIASLNYSVIPCSHDKRPLGKWQQAQQIAVSVLEVATMFSNAPAAAIVCGSVSDNLEIVDVDCKYDVSGDLWDKYCELIEDESPGLLDTVLIQTTPSGGYHIIYKSEQNVPGNKKLARRHSTNEELLLNEFDKVKVLIETRGEGGYALIAPSPGYVVVQGSWDSIPVLTEHERNVFIQSAAALNEYEADLITQGEYRAATISDQHGLKPGSDYNERGDHAALLIKNGWQLYKNGGNTEYWTRPGKDKGVSAVWNSDKRKFAVFSSSSQLRSVLDDRTTYSLFGLFAELECQGDFTKAGKELRKQGYGSPIKTSSVVDDKGNVISKQFQNKQYQAIHDFVQSVCQLRKNVIKGQFEIQFHGEEGWRELTDSEENLLWADFTQHTRISMDVFRRIIDAYCSPRFDPFKEYFSTLTAWDGSDHITHLLTSVTPIDAHAAIWNIYLKRWLIGLVATHHGYEPNHTVLVIKGEQGVGKTRWLNNICPEQFRSEYVFVGAIDPANKDSLLYIAQKWMINLDELETMNRYELGQIKSILTMKTITTRKPYARQSETMKRRASFCGSVNKSEFLSDDTGNRRYLVVEAESIDLDTQAQVNIDQVFAQALHLLRKGEKYWFDGKEIDEINAINDAYRTKTELEEIVETHLENDTSEAPMNFYTPTQLRDKLRDSFPVLKTMNLDYMRRALGQILVKNGFNKRAKKVDGVVVYGYYAKINKRELTGEDVLF